MKPKDVDFESAKTALIELADRYLEAVSLGYRDQMPCLAGGLREGQADKAN